MMVTIKVIKIRMMMMALVTMVIIVMSVVENLKEELTEGHLLAPEERAASDGERSGVPLHGRVLLPPALLPSSPLRTIFLNFENEVIEATKAAISVLQRQCVPFPEQSRSINPRALGPDDQR